MSKVVKKEALRKWLKSLAADFEVIGPKESAPKGIFYEPLTDMEELYLGEGFAVEPVKKFFLEPSEELFRCDFQEGKDVAKDKPLPDNKRVIIGVRPCEARGLTLLDKVFDADLKDKSYVNNRSRTIIVGLACGRPDPSCFCTSMGGSPVEARGMDVFLFDLGDDFVVDICTAKGREAFGSLEAREIDEESAKALEAYREKRKGLITKKFKAPDDLAPVFESEYWDKASFACLSCGVCTYLCPTCHCFDLVDEERKRLRCYDGCAFSDFTLEASGVNPRPTRKERYRQRAFHKFDFFKKNFDENLCVGCGRCIRHCPVKMDIAEIVVKASKT